MYCENTDCIFRSKTTGICKIPEDQNLTSKTKKHGFLCLNHITELKDASPEAVRKYLSQDGVMLTTRAGDTCANCRYRKEKRKGKPQECTECGYEKYRDEPYYSCILEKDMKGII